MKEDEAKGERERERERERNERRIFIFTSMVQDLFDNKTIYNVED